VGEAVIAASTDRTAIEAIIEAARRLELSVHPCEEGTDLVEEIAQPRRPMLVVLDLDPLPAAGLGQCRRIRSATDAPLIVIGSSAEKATLIRTLKAGADHYLPKPLDPELLSAYFEAALRRKPVVSPQPRLVTIRNLTVDRARKEIRIGVEVVPVTRTEFKLLSCLAENLGRVISCSELVREIGGYDCPEQEAQQIVKVHVSRLRGKIDRDPAHPSYIANVRGFGYLLERRTADEDL